MDTSARLNGQFRIASHLVRKYREEKITLQELAAMHDVSITTVWRQLKRCGIDRGSKRGRPSTRKNYPEVIELAAQGWTRRQIAEHLGLTPEWVRCILAEHGLTVSLRILKCRKCGAGVTDGHKAERNGEALCKFCLQREQPTFAQRLKTFRLAENLSQAQLSKKTGLSQSMIGNYERNQGKPTFASVQKLARGLGVKTAALVDGMF
jgi:transcriptional regulator with XRE-family HTH domain